MPYVDPSALLRGEENQGNRFCFLFGTTALFSAQQMASLCVDEAGFVAQVADAIIPWAPQQWRTQIGGE